MINFLKFLDIIKTQNKLLKSKLLVETSLRDMMNEFGITKQDLIVLGPYDVKDKDGKIKHYDEVLFHYTDKNYKFESIMKQGLIANADTPMKLSEKGIYLGNTPLAAHDTYSTRLRGPSSETRLLVIDASKIDKNELDFDTVEFFRRYKEQNKNQEDRYYTKFDVNTGLLDYNYDDDILNPPQQKKDDNTPNYKVKLASFFTNFIFNASLIYRKTHIPVDAIIDVYGPGWNSSIKNNNRGVGSICKQYQKNNNDQEFFIKRLMPRSIKLKLYNLVDHFFRTLKNKYDDIRSLSDNEIKQNKNIIDSTTELLINKINEIKQTEEYQFINTDLNNQLDNILNIFYNINNYKKFNELKEKIENIKEINIDSLLSNNNFAIFNRLFNNINIDINLLFKENDIGTTVKNYFKNIYAIYFISNKNNNLNKILVNINNEIKQLKEYLYDFYEFSAKDYRFNKTEMLNINKIFQKLEDYLLEYNLYFEYADIIKKDMKLCLDVVKNKIMKKADYDLNRKNVDKNPLDKLKYGTQIVFNRIGAYNKIMKMINQIDENI